jgi:hypothetical protein
MFSLRVGHPVVMHKNRIIGQSIMTVFLLIAHFFSCLRMFGYRAMVLCLFNCLSFWVEVICVFIKFVMFSDWEYSVLNIGQSIVADGILRIKGAAFIHVDAVYDITRVLACVNLFCCWLLISLVLRLPDLGDHHLFIHIFGLLSDIRSMTSTSNKGSWRKRLVQGMNHVNFALTQNTISYYTAQTN